VKIRRPDCKYCGKELTEGNTNRHFCCVKHRVYWNRENKEKAKKPIIKDLTKPTNVIKPIEPPKTNYSIKTDNADKAMEIAMEMKKIQMEKIPPERDKSTMGRKSWAIEQKKKLADLQKQLDELI
jgi:hypothetical protein